MTQLPRILHLFPRYLQPLWQEIAMDTACLQEIRLRTNRPLLIQYDNREFFMTAGGKKSSSIRDSYLVTEADILAILNHLCKDSL